MEHATKPNMIMAFLGKAPGSKGGLGSEQEKREGRKGAGIDDDDAAPTPDPALKDAATDVMGAFKSGNASELTDALHAFVSMCK